MAGLSDVRLSKNMKYTALYVAMRFFEHEPDVFEKIYENEVYIKIDASSRKVYINSEEVFELDTHESFVKLECINRLLTLGYKTDDYKLLDDPTKIYFKGYEIIFTVWDEIFNLDGLTDKKVLYKSRLVSGLLEYKTKIKNDSIFDYGLFEEKENINLRKRLITNYDAPDFVIEENRVMQYIGKSKIVIVPDGIEELESSAFWDNQYIEEVILPDSLINMGGDTFYNCRNLKKVNIPKSVLLMGNNPFAGCPVIEITQQSNAYVYENGALYTSDKKTLIYYSIKGEETEFVIPEGVIIICKHAFYLCERLQKITLPASLEKMENNPFSGCSKLKLINLSKAYYIKDDVIYNSFKTSVVGALNKIKAKRLELLDGIKTINRNSFWNCKGIESIVFPESLNDIGYNPFVGCTNIRFESKSPDYKVVDGVLYNKDMSKLICYPAWKAVGTINIPESVITLERGAFSGCRAMTALNLHNVNIVNKSCFTNCTSIKNLYCSDLITYIGEWAFAYCESLQTVSINRDTIVDNNAFSNCPAQLVFREKWSNYLIESDNKFTLLSMQKAYKKKIDSILIDPPYNSHIDYIGYKDGDYEEGFLNFMALRLNLSYTLLSEQGFLVINIDEGEVKNLAKLCVDIFGIDLVKVYKWKKLHDFFDANRNVRPDKKVVLHEYIIICRKTEKALLNKIMQPYIENGVLKERTSDVPQIFDCFGTTSSAKDEIKEVFGSREYFSTPKPLKLMKELMRATTNKNSIVMDYFAGSGTVGHACVELNREDKGNRKFILISNDESNICRNVTKKRLDLMSADYEFLT